MQEKERRPRPRGWSRTSPGLLAYYESKLLSHLLVPFKVYQVKLQNENPKFNRLCNEYINTLEVLGHSDANSTRKPTIVIIHVFMAAAGFASALATFVNLFQPLSDVCKVFAIDLLGFGRSSKPQFPTGDKGMAAESLFTESIEVWRLQMGIQSMILCAHSFGAYIAVSYSHKFPDAVQGLVLFEPWGFHQTNGLSSQVNQRWHDYILSMVNPLWVLKIAGPIAFPVKRLLTRDLFEKSFAGIGSGDEMIQYLYHSNVQCTGDAGFMSLLSPFYIPLRPMSISGLAPNLHITLIYGSNSWIDSKAGYRILVQERGDDPPYTFIEMIPGAGHQVYAEQLDLFLAAVLRAINSIIRHP